MRRRSRRGGEGPPLADEEPYPGRMTWRILMLMGLGSVGCGSVNSVTPDAATGEDAATADAPAPPCDLSKPFGAAVVVPGLHDPAANDVHATLTDDELTVYFASNRPNTAGDIFHIYAATRTTVTAGFDTPMQVGPLFSMEGESHPAISADGNTIFFDSFRTSTGGGVVHMWTSTRSNAGVAFSTPTQVRGENLIAPALTGDGSALYVSNLNSGLLSRLPTAGGAFGVIETVSVPYQFSITSPVTRDELALYLSEGDTTGHLILSSKRASKTAAWPTATAVSELSTGAALAEPSWISADGCRLYLTYQATSGKSTIHVATRPK
jgi:hypothetical protein